MFSKKSSGSKANKNPEPTPKGALLTPPENLYIPESRFVPDTQYGQEQQPQQSQYMQPEQQQQQQQQQQQYMQDQQQYMQDQNAYMQSQNYMPQDTSYMSQMQDPSAYLSSEPTQMTQGGMQQQNMHPSAMLQNPMQQGMQQGMQQASMQQAMQQGSMQRAPMAQDPMNMSGQQINTSHSNKPQDNQPSEPAKGNVIPIDSSNVKILFDGYSKFVDGDYFANCTCTLIKGGPNIVVDTMTVWDEDKLVGALRSEGISPEEIDFVICTHGHSDHTGCNHLFKNAIHIVGFSISHKDQYYLHPDFRHGEEFNIDPSTNSIKIIPTPGHTLQDVTVLVYTNIGTLAITGDLFEKAEDLENEYEWLQAGSDNATLQRRNRQKVLDQADYIIPGHGPIFKVPEKFKKMGKMGSSNMSAIKPMTMGSTMGY